MCCAKTHSESSRGLHLRSNVKAHSGKLASLSCLDAERRRDSVTRVECSVNPPQGHPLPHRYPGTILHEGKKKERKQNPPQLSAKAKFPTFNFPDNVNNFWSWSSRPAAFCCFYITISYQIDFGTQQQRKRKKPWVIPEFPRSCLYPCWMLWEFLSSPQVSVSFLLDLLLIVKDKASKPLLSAVTLSSMCIHCRFTCVESLWRKKSVPKPTHFAISRSRFSRQHRAEQLQMFLLCYAVLIT